jgi:hypothetical protein
MGKPFDDAQKEQKIDKVLEVLDGDNPFDLKVRETSVRDTTNLFCFGCAHSAADIDFPGGPSGERPCFFCVRNPNREKWQADFKKRHGGELKEWYDNTPIAFYPMDVYQTLDMKEQIDRWVRKAQGDPNWNSPMGGMKFG